MDNRIKILIAFPFVFIIILFIAANYIPFKGELTKTEEHILAFMPAELAVRKISDVPVQREIKSPMDFSTPASAGIQGGKSDLAHEKTYNDNAISLIVVSGKRKMAIIRGILVTEGDIIDGMRIAKIEPDRVLLKNKTERWIFLEKAR
jgi:hypothetical protein